MMIHCNSKEASMRAKHFFLCFSNSRIYGEDLVPVNAFNPDPYCGGTAVVDLFFIVTPIVCGDSAFGPCFVIQYFVSV